MQKINYLRATTFEVQGDVFQEKYLIEIKNIFSKKNLVKTKQNKTINCIKNFVL